MEEHLFGIKLRGPVVVTNASAVQTEMCKSALGILLTCSTVCEFVACMEVLKEVLYICIGITVGKVYGSASIVCVMFAESGKSLKSFVTFYLSKTH